MKNKLKRLVNQVLGLFPSRLPVGVTEFDSWAESIIDTYPMPTSNRDSLKFTLATIIMHQGTQDAYRSKFYFYLTINAAAAKQIAGEIFYSIKQKQKEEAERAAKEEAEKSSGAAS